MKKVNLLLMLAICSLFYVGCEKKEIKTVAPVKEVSPEKEAPREKKAEGITEEERIAMSLWEELDRKRYRTWNMWPDKGAFYEGREPHGTLLTTYVNDVAFEAIENKEGKLPYGAIVVKENFKPDKTLVAITVMEKREGYNPEGNDWFWVKFDPNGKVASMEKLGVTMILAGKVPGCLECHGKKSDNDFIFTGSLKGVPAEHPHAHEAEHPRERSEAEEHPR